jgi:hypothetical protein
MAQSGRGTNIQINAEAPILVAVLETVIFIRNVFNDVSDHKLLQPRNHYELHRHENLKIQYN